MSAIITSGLSELYKILSKARSDRSLNISGGIYKLRRPLDSKEEDIVINAITLSGGEYMQRGYYNVNCYVENLPESKLPNTQRLGEIAYKVNNLLEECWGDNYVFYIENMTLFEEENTTFYNFRIRQNIIKH